MDTDLPGLEPETNACLELRGAPWVFSARKSTFAPLPFRSGMDRRRDTAQVAEIEKTGSMAVAMRYNSRSLFRRLQNLKADRPLALVHAQQSSAQEEGPALPDDSLTMARMIDDLSDGSITLDSLRRNGLDVFTTSFNTFDGYGDDPRGVEVSTAEPGHRPTLQGNGLTLRVNRLYAQSCNECHSFVKRSTRPPVLGIGGVGGIVQNAMILPTLIEVADSGDSRVNYTSGYDPNLALQPDGAADFNGRYANPPFLFGGGGVELLAKEMTRDLQRVLADARDSEAETVTRLVTHGLVQFVRREIGEHVTAPGREILKRRPVVAADLESRHVADPRRLEFVAERAQAHRERVAVDCAAQVAEIETSPVAVRAATHVGDHRVGMKLRVAAPAGQVAEKRGNHPVGGHALHYLSQSAAPQ